MPVPKVVSAWFFVTGAGTDLVSMNKQFLPKDKTIHELAFPTLPKSNITEADGGAGEGESGPQLSNKYFCSLNSYYVFEIKQNIITCLKIKQVYFGKNERNHLKPCLTHPTMREVWSPHSRDVHPPNGEQV